MSLEIKIINKFVNLFLLDKLETLKLDELDEQTNYGDFKYNPRFIL
jgi:hypothetical protein